MPVSAAEALFFALVPYLAMSLVVVAGMWRAARRPLPSGPAKGAKLGEAVVVVAARDEARRIVRCVDALLAQDHPRLRIVVADDGSTDGTGDLVRKTFGRAITVLDIPQDDTSPLRGKARALAYALAHVRAETPRAALLFTDADCVAPPGWARAMAAGLAAQPRPGVLGAAALVRPAGGFAAAQTLEWALEAGAAAGLSAWGWTVSAMGNNLAVSPEAYDAVGGFEGLPVSTTEDHALVRAVAKQRYTARYHVSAPHLLETEAVPTFLAFLRQRQRWARGGFGDGPAVLAFYVFVWASHLAFLAALGTGLWAVAGMKVAADALVLLAVQRRMGRRLPWAWFGLFQVLLVAYLLIVPAMLLTPVAWKGRKF